jgi:hypothetical protein
VLWCNLIPRVFLSAWAIAVGMCIFTTLIQSDHSGADARTGHFSQFLPTKAILAGPFLVVLGGECVFQSAIFTLTSALTEEYVERYVL